MAKSKRPKPYKPKSYPCAVLAIDPGVSTGYTVMLFTEDDVDLLETGVWYDPDFVWETIRDKLKELHEQYEEVVLVVEQFDKRPGVVNPDFTPKYVVRDIENNLLDEHIVMQIPAAAMNLVKTARRAGRSDHLKRFRDWYKTNNVHGNDATRHAIVYGVEVLRHMPLIRMGWPKPND